MYNFESEESDQEELKLRRTEVDGVIQRLGDITTTETPIVLSSGISTPMESPGKGVLSSAISTSLESPGKGGTPTSSPIKETPTSSPGSNSHGVQHQPSIEATKSTGFEGFEGIQSSTDINALGVQKKGVLETDKPPTTTNILLSDISSPLASPMTESPSLSPEIGLIGLPKKGILKTNKTLPKSTEFSPEQSVTPLTSPEINPLGVQKKGILKTNQPFVQSVVFNKLVDDPDFSSKIKQLPNSGPLHPDRVKDTGLFQSQSSSSLSQPSTPSQSLMETWQLYINNYVTYPLKSRKEDNQRPKDAGDNLKAGDSKLLSKLAQVAEDAKLKKTKLSINENTAKHTDPLHTVGLHSKARMSKDKFDEKYNLQTENEEKLKQQKAEKLDSQRLHRNEQKRKKREQERATKNAAETEQKNTTTKTAAETKKQNKTATKTAAESVQTKKADEKKKKEEEKNRKKEEEKIKSNIGYRKLFNLKSPKRMNVRKVEKKTTDTFQDQLDSSPSTSNSSTKIKKIIRPPTTTTSAASSTNITTTSTAPSTKITTASAASSTKVTTTIAAGVATFKKIPKKTKSPGCNSSSSSSLLEGVSPLVPRKPTLAVPPTNMDQHYLPTQTSSLTKKGIWVRGDGKRYSPSMSITKVFKDIVEHTKQVATHEAPPTEEAATEEAATEEAATEEADTEEAATNITISNSDLENN